MHSVMTVVETALFRFIQHNYERLKLYSPLKEKEIYSWSKDNLGILKAGFNPEFFTSIFVDGNSIWYYVFEHGFIVGDRQLQVR
jgi:hypothetical protein